jgi:hypothetical protein
MNCYVVAHYVIMMDIMFTFQLYCNNNTLVDLVVVYSCPAWYKYYLIFNDLITLAFIIWGIFIRSFDALAMF